jgi:hypothetical protein
MDSSAWDFFSYLKADSQKFTSVGAGYPSQGIGVKAGRDRCRPRLGRNCDFRAVGRPALRVNLDAHDRLIAGRFSGRAIGGDADCQVEPRTARNPRLEGFPSEKSFAWKNRR